MKPNRTKKAKRFRFHPIKKHVEDEQSDEEEPQQFLYRSKLGGLTPAIREEITAYLANICEVPAELREPDTLRLLVERLGKEQPAVTYNAIFAIKNLIELDKTFMGQLVQLNLLNSIASVLQQMASSSSKDIAKKIVEAVYILLLTLAETVSFEQLSQFDRSDQFRGYVTYLLAVLRQTTVMDQSEPALEFLKVVAEYTVNLRQLILEEETKYHSLERIFIKGEGRLQCVTCYVLLFVGASLQPTTIAEMVNLFNHQVNSCNLEEQYKHNFGPQQSKECGMNEQEAVEDFEEEVEKDEDIEVEVEKPGKEAPAVPNKDEMFMESVEMANVMTQWLLSVLEKDEESFEDEDDEEIETKTPFTVNTGTESLKSELKNRLNSVQGVIRNTQLTYPGALQLVDMSWRVVQISLQYLNQEKILANAFASLALFLAKPEYDEIGNSIVETCLSIALEIWDKHFQNPKIVLPAVFDNLIAAAERVLPSNSTDKSKMVMLELLGHRYNPEKRPVTAVENQRIGALLKTVMMTSNSSNLTLQCQCLDTLFDIYCNEDFDVTFKELGLIGFLETALQAMKSLNKKSKFFRQVAQDLKRFIDYKQQQLIRQNLL